jgi:hypothetical protein
MRSGFQMANSREPCSRPIAPVALQYETRASGPQQKLLMDQQISPLIFGPTFKNFLLVQGLN